MKKPWLACLLNIIFPGVGYIYVGNRVMFGILFFISSLIVFSSSLSLEDISIKMLGIIIVSGVFQLIALAYDAYKDAEEVNFRAKKETL